MSGGELWEADAAFNGQGLWGLVRGFGFWAKGVWVSAFFCFGLRVVGFEVLKIRS